MRSIPRTLYRPPCERVGEARNPGPPRSKKDIKKVCMKDRLDEVARVSGYVSKRRSDNCQIREYDQ